MRLARLLLVFCCAVSLIAVAQEKKPAAAPDKGKPAAADKQKKSAKPAGMPSMKPSPEIQKMAKSLVGSYTTKEMSVGKSGEAVQHGLGYRPSCAGH